MCSVSSRSSLRSIVSEEKSTAFLADLAKMSEDHPELARGMLTCCPINITEVYMGMRPNETERTEKFLASLEFYPVTWEVAKYAGELYRQWRVKGLTLALPDLHGHQQRIAASVLSLVSFYNRCGAGNPARSRLSAG